MTEPVQDDEMRVLDPDKTEVLLSDGTRVYIEPLRARQFFKLLRIVTRGALPNMQDFSLFRVGSDMEASEFAGRFLSLMLLSIPEAENEAIDFINSMVRPVGLIERPSGMKLNKQDIERNTVLWTDVITVLDNPELDDLVTIVEAIVRREAADIQALGKRLAAMFKLAEKTGQVPSPAAKTAETKAESPLPPLSRSRTSPDESFSDPSAEPGISSPVSTDGTTSASVTSLSVDFDKLQQPSPSDASTSVGSESSG